MNLKSMTVSELYALLEKISNQMFQIQSSKTNARKKAKQRKLDRLTDKINDELEERGDRCAYHC
ncbi:MAG: hypothetical protein KDC67_08830 [Ignavibacteriae bacterium]|nr:hypothetical protein [Ignavibacteriota bacterium]